MAPKNQHVVNFQTTETSLLPFIHQMVKTHNEWPFYSSKDEDTRSCLLFVEKEDKIWDTKEKASPLNEPSLRGIVSLVKRIHKEKTCPRGKRQ